MNTVCPDVRLAFSYDDVDPIEAIEVTCNPDGTASVKIRIKVDNTTSRLVICRGECGPGGVMELSSALGLTPGAEGEFSFTCRYNTPSTPAPYVEVLDVNFEPFGCPDFQVPVGPLAACPISSCPQIQSVEVEIMGCSRDTEGGDLKRRVIFTPSVSLPAGIADHVWFFGDGESDPGNGPPVQTEHLYEVAPSVPPQLCIFPADDTCEEECLNVPLSDFADFRLCECPQIAGIDVQIGNCERDPSDGQLKRRVTFVPTLTGPSPSAYNWTFGDGSSDVGAGSPGTVSHLYEQVPTTPPRLCIQAGAPCEEVCRDVPLSEFDGFEPCAEDGDGDGDGGPSWCGVLTFAIAALAALALTTTLVLLTVQFCLSIPVPGWLWGIVIGLAAAVAVLIALSYFLCWAEICPCLTKCDWLVIAWVPALAGAIIALYLAGCCGWMGYVALGLAAAAAATFALWKRSCDPTRCEVVDWLLTAIVSGVTPAITYINLIPMLRACGNGWVAAAAASLAVALLAAATYCRLQTDQQARLP